jgi:ribosomal-protein-alanine N-acetyltransferase
MGADASPLVLETERLILCLPGPEAAARLVSYFETNRSHLAPWEPPFPAGLFTLSFWRQRLEQNHEEFREGRSLRLVLLRRDAPDGAVVGMANFTQMVRGALMGCQLGYSLDRDAEGKGLMTEALRVAIRYVFEDAGMHRVMASYMPSNERSGRLLRRLGFVVEGYARDYLFVDGAWRDHILAALTSARPRPPDYVAGLGRRAV